MTDDDSEMDDERSRRIVVGIVAESLILTYQDDSIVMLMTDEDSPALIHYLSPQKARQLAATILNMADKIDVEEVM